MQNKRRLVVVLGMHRSGTSAITRGLKTMGVELGDRLIPPNVEANAKGYWEDIDLNSLNNEMLIALGTDWHHLVPITPGDVERLHKKGYFLSAVELLRLKVERTCHIFGFKDPRVTKLLPFWQEVFKHCCFDVSYVLALRNPLSVAKSLANRDGFCFEKSYLLWLEHVLVSIAGTHGQKCVLVDYDRLMHSPESELGRMAKTLDLTIDLNELHIYETDFLDEELRHTVYVPNDLSLDDACHPLVGEIYAELLDVAFGKVSIDGSALNRKMPLWIREFGRLKSSLTLADKLYAEGTVAKQAIAEREEQITGLNQAIAERDAQISSFNQAIAERDAQIRSLNQAVSERDEQIASLNRVAADRQRAYQCHVLELETAVGAEQDRSFLLASEVAGLRSRLNNIAASRSWRLTAPLRRAYAVAHHAPDILYRRAIAAYRALPIKPSARHQLKQFVFSTLGFAFVRMDAYQRWKQYRQIKTDWPATGRAESGAPVATTLPGTVPALPYADGAWEWSDYDAVKSRITEVKARYLANVSATPMDLIDIGDESFSSVAARVKLPALVDEPDVSIILPVFNNIKLTLECLLSIAAHSDPNVAYEIIVADDASTDETEEVVRSIPRLRVVRNERNLGFLRNCNQALKSAQGRYVLYLNNDVQVTAGWLYALLGTFDSQPKAGAVGPRFVYPSGHLQEAGVAFHPDGTAEMIGLNEDPAQARFSYPRRVDYVSGACLMLPTQLAKQLGGFSEEFLPCYCEDSDLCLSVQQAGYYVYYNPAATIVHHLSKTIDAIDTSFKMRCISRNLVTLQNKWQHRLESYVIPKVVAFYLPQFHPIPENNKWWGNGFTDWSNVTKARPNFVGHYQPRIPADLGHYDLRLSEVMEQQADLARRYGLEGFCFYYYWFDGKRLLDHPIEQMLKTGKPDFPFCLCWANENWTRRWDGQDNEILIGQAHSAEDDQMVILDLIRYFRDARYIRIDERPIILVYRVTLFPNFAETAARWRIICREQGIGEIYIAMVESFDLVHANRHPKEFGCDAAVEFPPQGLAEQKPPTGEVINPNFAGSVADYRDLAARYATREAPGYTRFSGVIPGWDNTARRQNNSFCFEHATPGAFQAWLEEAIKQTRIQNYGDERLVFVNAWNEWAEGAYLEPDSRFGHAYLAAVNNALEASRLLHKSRYRFGEDGE